MSVSICTRKAVLYTTWYEFKKNLERKTGHMLPNWRWLEVKPKAPLPWDDADMEAALSRLEWAYEK